MSTGFHPLRGDDVVGGVDLAEVAGRVSQVI
jgi:hypothetical protein